MAANLYEFGTFILQPSEHRLLRDGRSVSLSPKAFDILLLLVQNAGGLVSKHDLAKKIWPSGFAEEANLTANIAALRKTLGLRPDGQEYIETVPRLGYRFSAIANQAVTGCELDPNSPGALPTAAAAQPDRAHVTPHGGFPAVTSTADWPLARWKASRNITLAVVVLVALLGVGLWLQSRRRSGLAQVNAGTRSIAVLPFQSLSSSPDQEYLGLGLPDALITQLGGLRQIVVRPTGSIRQYSSSGIDALAAGRELKVDSVLVGSVQRLEDRIRVTVRLLRVADGAQLWADTFDEKFTDLFSVEDSISQQVAKALALQLSGQEQQLLAKRYTQNSDAHELYLKGRYFWGKRTPAGLDESIRYFQQAIAADPQEPVRPSTASRTGSSTAPLEARELRGDLDHIVLKAMRKEPERRYASVAAFSEDVLRYLRGYPVEAASGARRYQARKFIGRHRAAVIAAAAAALALIAFGIEMGLLARRATNERLRAERQAQFLESIFQAATPAMARGQDVTARELLDQGAKRTHQELAGDPELQAAMLLNIGQAYDSLGLYTQAQPLIERAYQIRQRAPGSHRLDLAAAAQGLGTTLRLEDQYAKAEPLFREALAIRQQAPGNTNELVADSLTSLGECLYLENNDREAEALLRKALTIPLSADSTLRAGARDYLALELFRQGAYREAAQLLEEAVDITRRVEGEDSPDYANFLHNLAGAFLREGDLLDAIAMDRRDLALRRKVLGPDHPDVSYTLNNLGWALVESGSWKEAEPFLAESLTIVRKHFDSNSPRLVGPLDNWARLLQAKGDYAGAAEYYQQSLEMLQQTGGPASWSVAQILANIGVLQFDRGDYAGAERYARQALEMRRKLGGDEHPDVAASLIDLGVALWFQNDPAAAEPLARQALQIREAKLEPGHPDVLVAQVRLGEILTAEGKAAEAEPLLRKAVASARQPPFPLVPWQTAEAQNTLGACLVSLHRNSEAQALLQESEAPLETDPRPAFRHQTSAKLAALRTALHQN